MYRFAFKAMGSPCEIQLYGSDAAATHALAQRVIDDVRRLEMRYSRYRVDSELSRINQVAASGGAVEVDAETASLLDYADTCHRQSDGMFDITSGLLRKAWRFDAQRLPEQGKIDELLGRIGWHKLNWQRPRIEFPPGMELDFGGIVKEYAVDRGAALCEEAGCRHGIINLGGDIRILGPHPDGSPWQVGIRDPFSATPDALLSLPVLQGAVATSGDYERCITIDGRRYGHVLNPITGWPVRHFASVTVLADYCVIAGSASTITMLREQSGKAWLEELGLPHHWIDTQGHSGGNLSAAT